MKSMEKLKSGLILIALLILAFAAAKPDLVYAQAQPILELPNPLKADTFEKLVRDIAEWLYKIIIPSLATLVILYAGFLFMTSGGDEEKVKRAKRVLTWGMVGIAIVIIGYGFVELIQDIVQKK